MKFENQTFDDTTVNLDFNEFENCKFVRCVVVYTGSGSVQLHRCDFDECTFELRGAASRTMDFLEVMYGAGAGDLIEEIFDQVRTQSLNRHG